MVFWAIALAGAVAGVWCLRQAVKKPSPARPWLILGGWSLFAVTLVVAAPLMGLAEGPFAAQTLISFVGLCAVGAGFTLRKSKARPPKDALALEPSDRKRVVWRGWLRGVLAGPMAGIAAMGVGLFTAFWLPAAIHTQLIVGGTLVPLLWAAGMAWTLSDDKIVRAFFVLLGVSVVSIGLALLRGNWA